MDELNVGLIGVNAVRGWAREAHVPAVQGLPGLRLAAVSTRSAESARAAAETFGVERAYADPGELIQDPRVDVVAVTTPVPSHRDLVVAALEAGKHVLTEWPVGVGLAQTEEVAAAAERSPGRLAVSLQARTDPAVVAARGLLAEGRLGRVLTASAYSTTAGFGPVVPAGASYLEDPDAGMSLATIQAAHTLDLLERLAGRVVAMDALTSTQFPVLDVEGEEEPVRRTLADHVLLHARLDGGAVAGMQVAGGRPAGRTPFRLEVVGTEGRLVLAGGADRGFQAGRLSLRVDGSPVAVDEGERAGLGESVVNVAGSYAALRDDIVGGAGRTASAVDAVHLARLVEELTAPR